MPRLWLQEICFVNDGGLNASMCYGIIDKNSTDPCKIQTGMRGWHLPSPDIEAVFFANSIKPIRLIGLIRLMGKTCSTSGNTGSRESVCQETRSRCPGFSFSSLEIPGKRNILSLDVSWERIVFYGRIEK